jgi:hypothetical protein
MSTWFICVMDEFVFGVLLIPTKTCFCILSCSFTLVLIVYSLFNLLGVFLCLSMWYWSYFAWALWYFCYSTILVGSAIILRNFLWRFSPTVVYLLCNILSCCPVWIWCFASAQANHFFLIFCFLSVFLGPFKITTRTISASGGEFVFSILLGSTKINFYFRSCLFVSIFR